MCRPGLLDIITSFPVLIIMVYMKLTDSVASWIVKLPAFRIYILLYLMQICPSQYFDLFDCFECISDERFSVFEVHLRIN